MLQRLQGARGAGERPYRVNSVRCSPFRVRPPPVPPALTAGLQNEISHASIPDSEGLAIHQTNSGTADTMAVAFIAKVGWFTSN